MARAAEDNIETPVDPCTRVLLGGYLETDVAEKVNGWIFESTKSDGTRLPELGCS
jgi:hypothetical protein